MRLADRHDNGAAKPPSTATTSAYSRGIGHYRAGRHVQAIRELSSLCGGGDLIAKLAEFYRAMAHRALGVAALRSGRFGVGERHLRAAAGGVGATGEIGAYLTALYVRVRRYERAGGKMESAADAGDASALRMLAQLQWQAGRRVDAYMTLAGALRGHDDAQLHLQLGMFHAAESHHAEARECFRLAADADCTCWEAHYYLGLAAAAGGEIRQALRSLQRAVEIRPGAITAAYQLALAARAAGQVIIRLPERAAAPADGENWQLARYLAAEPGFVEAFLSLPASSADEELFGVLAGVLQMALTEHPGYADLDYYCSRVFARLGQVDVAIRHGEAAVEANGRYVKAMVHVAELYRRADRLVDAVEMGRRTIDAGADWPDVHCLMGELLDALGEGREARGHYLRALRLNADYPRATAALDRAAA